MSAHTLLNWTHFLNVILVWMALKCSKVFALSQKDVSACFQISQGVWAVLLHKTFISIKKRINAFAEKVMF
jgi:hypothetical protein